MDARPDDPTALARRSQRKRNELADRGEDDDGIETLRRRLVRPASPARADFASEILCRGAAGTRERKGGAVLPPRHLRHDVGGGA
jgi:hypothetical protein